MALITALGANTACLARTEQQEHGEVWGEGNLGQTELRSCYMYLMLPRARPRPSVSRTRVMGGAAWHMGSCHNGQKREVSCCCRTSCCPRLGLPQLPPSSCPPPRPGIWELFHGRPPPAEQQHRRSPTTTGDDGGTAAGACCCCSWLNLLLCRL